MYDRSATALGTELPGHPKSTAQLDIERYSGLLFTLFFSKMYKCQTDMAVILSGILGRYLFLPILENILLKMGKYLLLFMKLGK